MIQWGVFASSPNTIGWRHWLYPSIKEEKAWQKVAFIWCNVSLAETSSTRRGKATAYVRNFEGPLRSLTVTTMSEWPFRLPKQQQTEAPTTRALPDFISQWLNDMLFTPIGPHIINYEPPKGLVVPKFMMYDVTSDLFDHIMHFRQFMTLNIGIDALMYKVFSTNLLGQALS